MVDVVEQHVMGAGVLKRIEANAAIVGPGVVSAAMQKIDPALRAEIDALTPLTWIALSRVETLQDAIAFEAGRPPEALHDEAIRRSVEDALRTIYRIVLRMASDEWLVARTQMIFRKTRKIGTLVAEIPKPGTARIELTEWPGIRDRYVRQVTIGVERVLSLTGRENVAIEHLRHPNGASIRAWWEP